MQTFSMEDSLEPGFISINEETEIKLEKLLAPRMVKLKTEIKFMSISRCWWFRGVFSYNWQNFLCCLWVLLWAKQWPEKSGICKKSLFEVWQGHSTVILTGICRNHHQKKIKIILLRGSVTEIAQWFIPQFVLKSYMLWCWLITVTQGRAVTSLWIWCWKKVK